MVLFSLVDELCFFVEVLIFLEVEALAFAVMAIDFDLVGPQQLKF